MKHSFTQSVKIRLRSDVPLGILLSGGIDSSAITSISKKLSTNKITLLSSVSDQKEFDESYFINKMQNYLDWPIIKEKISNDPYELFLQLEKATYIADMPLSSLSNLAHYNLMRAARDNNIKVILSGQGADELLCGYRKYLLFFMQEKFQSLDLIGLIKIIISFSSNKEFLKQFNFADAKRYLPSMLGFLKNNTYGPALKHIEPISMSMRYGSKVSQRQFQDLMNFSVPTLNHFEDRMSMMHSREIRLPFLDHNLVELILSSPTSYKLANGWTKFSFRQSMKNNLPEKITWRRDKQGFINPQSEWIKKDLKNKIIHDYFNENAFIFKLDFYDRNKLLGLYDKFSSFKTNNGNISFKEIFYPLALEIWLRINENNISNLR